MPRKSKSIYLSDTSSVYLVGTAHKYEGGFDVEYVCSSYETACRRYNEIKDTMLKSLEDWIESAVEDGDKRDEGRLRKKSAELKKLNVGTTKPYEIAPNLFEIPWCVLHRLEE